MGIDFGGIIRKSFEIAWKYKSLWVFGLFAGAGGSKFNFESSPPVSFRHWNAEDWFDGSENLSRLGDFVHDFRAELLGVFILWVLFLILFAIICHLIAKPALIDGVNQITRGGHYHFGDSFSRGLDFFWKFFALLILQVFAFLALAVGIAVTAIVLTPFSLLLSIPAAIVIGFLLFHMFSLGEVALVARDTTIGEALAEGWQLVTHNVLNCLIITLLSIGFIIAFMIIFAVAGLLTFGPLNLLIATISDSPVAILLLGLVLGLPVSLVVGGYFGTFFNALYIQFYFGLVEPTPVPAAAAPASPSSGPAVS